MFAMAEETWSSGRGPACNNALCAYTPSRGVISVREIWPLTPPMDVAVPYARTMADLLDVIDVLVADDPDPTGDLWRLQEWVPLPRPSAIRPASYPSLLAAPEALDGLRLGVPRMYVNADLDAGTGTGPSLGGPSGLQLRRRSSGRRDDRHPRPGPDADLADSGPSPNAASRGGPTSPTWKEVCADWRRPGVSTSDWMTARGPDAVVFPAVADVGPGDMDRDPTSADFGWRNGVWIANGNLAIRHLGIPTVMSVSRSQQRSVPRPRTSDTTVISASIVGVSTPMGPARAVKNTRKSRSPRSASGCRAGPERRPRGNLGRRSNRSSRRRTHISLHDPRSGSDSTRTPSAPAMGSRSWSTASTG